MKTRPMHVLVLLMLLVCATQGYENPCPCLVYQFGANEPTSAPPAVTALEQMAAEDTLQGSLYGTSSAGAGSLGGKVLGFGTIFTFNPNDGRLKVIHAFDGTNGSNPFGGLNRGRDGNFYGSTYGGGQFRGGTVFMITPGDAPHAPTVFSFRNGYVQDLKPPPCAVGPCPLSPQQRLDAAGFRPTSAPVQATDNNFYLVTSHSNNYQFGVLYRVASGGATALCTGGPMPTDAKTTEAQLRDLCMFNGKTRGNFPSSLTAGKDGLLYGTTLGGQFSTNPYGTIFKATLAGIVTTLYTFHRTDGELPYSVIRDDTDGTLYGTTYRGGKYLMGVVFKLTATGQFSVLHDFTGTRDGSNPVARLTLHAGDLYGTTNGGGLKNAGVVFRLNAATTVFDVIHDFDSVHDGRIPHGSPLLHPNGNLYGTTFKGGKTDQGVLYGLPVQDQQPRIVAPGQLVYEDAEVQVNVHVVPQQLNVPSPYKDMIAIKVKCVGDARVVQFAYRTVYMNGKLQTQLPEELKTTTARDVGETTKTYETTTDLAHKIWHVDSRGRPNPYYTTGKQYRCDPGSMTILDQPSLLAVDANGNYIPLQLALGNPTLRFTGKAYAVCDGRITREITWVREQQTRNPTTGKPYDPVYPLDPATSKTAPALACKEGSLCVRAVNLPAALKNLPSELQTALTTDGYTFP